MPNNRTISKIRFVFALAVSLVLIGCAGTQKQMAQSLSRRITTTQSEQRWASGFGRAHSGGNALNQQGMPSGIGWQGVLDRLVYVSPLRGYPIRLAVIQDSNINAFTDGKSIAVSDSLLHAFQNDDSAVASVLAHELGHVLAQHHAESGTSHALGFVPYLTPALAVVPFGGWISMGVNESLRMGRASYNRHQENEADAIGVLLALKAGYDGRGLGDFLEYRKSSGFGRPANVSVPLSVGAIPQSAATTLLSTTPLYRQHPPSKKRQKYIELLAARFEGRMSSEELRKKAAWLEKIFQTLQERSPKDR